MATVADPIVGSREMELSYRLLGLTAMVGAPFLFMRAASS